MFHVIFEITLNFDHILYALSYCMASIRVATLQTLRNSLTIHSTPAHTYIHTTKFVERQNRKERIRGAGTE